MRGRACLRLFWHFAPEEGSRTFCTAGSNRPMRIAMIAITTNALDQSETTTMNGQHDTLRIEDKDRPRRIFSTKTDDNETRYVTATGERVLLTKIPDDEPRGDRHRAVFWPSIPLRRIILAQQENHLGDAASAWERSRVVKGGFGEVGEVVVRKKPTTATSDGTRCRGGGGA